MANTSISNLTAAGALTGLEQLPLVQTLVTKRTTLNDIKDFVQAGVILRSVATATLAAVGNSITVSAGVMELNNTSGGSLTLTSTPTIAAGMDEGTEVTLVNTSANNVVLQSDPTGLLNTKLKLGAATRTLGVYGTLSLVFVNGFWCEKSFLTAAA